MERKNKYTLKSIIILILAIIVAFSFIPLSSEAKPVSKRIVKIGYYENGAFQSGARDDLPKKGYAYDYLQKLQVYTNWKYEYVYGDYGDLYNMLLSGEIDMLAGLAYTEERSKLIGYPDVAMGNSTYVFVKNKSATDITTDPKTLNGKSIGVIDGAMKLIVKDYLSANSIDAEIVTYFDIVRRDEAFSNNEIDVIIAEGESTERSDYMELLYEVGNNDMFICVTKDRPDILAELNQAQEALFNANPQLISVLSDTWFKSNIMDTAISSNEEEWLNNHKMLNVGCYAHCIPYSMTDDNGEITGAIVELVPELFRNLGIEDIEINYIAFENFDEMTAALNAGTIDLTFPAYSEYWTAEKNGITPTAEVFSLYFTWVFKDSEPDMQKARIAIQKTNSFLLAYREIAFSNNEVVYCDTVFDCLDSVLSGKADATILSVQAVDSLLKSKEKYMQLNSVMITDGASTGFGVTRNDSGTLEIINHGIYLLDASFVTSLSYKYTSRGKVTFRDFIRQNLTATIIGIVILAVVIIAITLRELDKKKKIIKREEEQKTELGAQLEEITALNIELEDNQEKMENQMTIIQSMSKVYFSSFYIDIEDDSFIELSSIDNIRKTVGSKGKAQESLFIMSEKLVLPEFSQKMREFADLSTLDERMADSNVVTFDYIGVTSGWSQAYLISGDRDRDGKLKHAFFATRMIHKEKEREEAQNRSIEEAREVAEAANNAKTSFLFNMSHDIRTPMNAIIGFRDLLEKHQEDPKKREDYLHKIEDASSVLLSIINNVLEMARIEKGTIELDESAWSIEQFNDTIYSVFDEMMLQKNITFKREAAVEHHYVYCDPIKLREVFINILSNAYKYTNTGGTVSMKIEELPGEKEGWSLYKTTISDTGIGMSSEFLPHIFEEFSREKNTTENKIEGTGLGMPIVKRLVELMNGTIEVSSEKGKGSVFTVTIPHRLADKSMLVEHSGMEFDPKIFEGKRILLAEDNELNAEIAMEILKEAGLNVEHAEDGAECLRMLKEAEDGYYKLILMDIQMPNMNGYEATRAIRTLDDYEKANIPIVAMTANAFEEDKREAFRAGMNAHLAKPINVRLLLRELTRILS